MQATKKAAHGAGTPTAAEGQERLTDNSTSGFILPQDEQESTRIVSMIVKNLCRLYGEATGQEIIVKSVRRRDKVKAE